MFGVLAVLVGGFAVVGFGARLGCLLSGGGRVPGGWSAWATVTARVVRGRSLGEAWRSVGATGVPSTVLLWVTTGLVALVTGAVGGVGWVGWRRYTYRSTLGPLGVPGDARMAERADLAPIIVASAMPPKGRMLLGRLRSPSGGSGPFLATEDRAFGVPPLPSGARRAFRGRAGRARFQDRGSVALIGPTGSQKTQMLISAITAFDGVVVAVSAKGDLAEATIAARSDRGEVAVFDPSSATRWPSARWSPVEATLTVTGAYKVGAGLAESIPKSGVTNADYWARHGESLLGSFMVLAGLSRLLGPADGWMEGPVGLEQIATWVTISAGSADPTINHLLRCAARPGLDLEVQLMARRALSAFVGLQREDSKIVSSIYTTARLAVEPWLEPAIAHSATRERRRKYNETGCWAGTPRYVDLDWLMADRPDGSAGLNTLYLSADSGDFQRLAPVLGGLLAGIKDEIHAWDIRAQPVPKPLMIVIDEAGQLGFSWLPREVSTIAGLGAFYVTAWQSVAQIHAAYGPQADTVLAGHPTTVVFSGVKDTATARAILPLLGHHHVTRHTESRDGPAGWGLSGKDRAPGRSVSTSRQREQLADERQLREMAPGQALLFHRTLPAATIEVVRWWENPTIGALIPVNGERRPDPPTDLATCPLTPDPTVDRELADTAIDRRTIDAAVRLLPPSPPTTATSTSPAAAPVVAAGGVVAVTEASSSVDVLEPVSHPTVPSAAPVDPAPADRLPRQGALVGSGVGPVPGTNRRAGLCTRCGELVQPWAGTEHTDGTATVVAHHPACPDPIPRSRS